MKVCLYCVGTIGALVLSSCFADSAFAQGSLKPRNKSNSGSSSLTRGSDSTSSSMSFKKDGKKVSIKEDKSGITVTFDGRSVRARNLDELKQQYPDAYQLYAEKPGISTTSTSRFGEASGNGTSSSSKGSEPGDMESKSSKSKDRNITVVDNGRKVTISENASGITVTVDGKSLRVRDAKELKNKSAVAYRLYKKHLDKPDPKRMAPNAKDLLKGNFNAGPNAKDLLREKLMEMQNKRALDPKVQDLIQRMLQEVDK